MKGWMYILLCSDESYYTGSTNNQEQRILEHQTGNGANHTKKRLPVTLIYCEEYDRIDEAFYREKQVQRWRRKKKEALIAGAPELLPKLALSYRSFDAIQIAESFIPTDPGAFETLASRALRHRDLRE